MNSRIKISSLDMEARGVGHQDGKVIFVEGALPGEVVSYQTQRRKPSYEIAQLTQIYQQSSQRVQPSCAYFGRCGGCSMQHLDAAAQVAIKQRVLEDNLWHIARIRPQTILRPIYGPAWKYRYRARLSVRYLEKKGGTLVGFHERKRSYVADMLDCHILPRHVADLLPELRKLINQLSIRERIPQIELAVGSQVTALVLRVLEPLSFNDKKLLCQFADQYPIQFWLQPQGPDSATLFYPLNLAPLSYELPEYRINFKFKPTDFTQINHQINRVLVQQALHFLDVQTCDRIVDFFCGLGNFTLPIARKAMKVIGIEGSPNLIERAQENALDNQIMNADFLVQNLFEFTLADWQMLNRLEQINKILVDPPRDGAVAIAKVLAHPDALRPGCIVYVSCNPATLARDAAILVHEAGYQMTQAGIINMFPHTSHIESIAVFKQI